jgi:hypothetical protein
MVEDSKKKATKLDNNQQEKLHGKFVFQNGDIYEGEYEVKNLESIQRHGQGTLTTHDGVVYTGTWINDKLNGKGVFIHPSGMKYEGDFVDGRFEGRGSYNWPDGSSYEGEFKASKLEGYGSYKDVKGQLWSGRFRGSAALGLRFNLRM